MSRRIIFVINPIAGTRPKDGLEHFLRQKADQDGYEYRVVIVAKQYHTQALYEHIETFAPTDVVACGGDGTVNMVASALMNTEINLGIIPVGSGNGLSRAAYIPMKPTEAYEVIRKGKVMRADSFCANRHFAFMLSGIGMDARVAARFATNGRRGFFTYMTETIREFYLAKTHRFRISIDQFEFETNAYFVSVANGNQFGNNVTIAPLASMDDGKLDLVVVQQMPKLFLFVALLRQLKATNYQPLGKGKPPKGTLLYFKGRDITIHNPTRAPLHVDGDPVETSEKVSFHVRPGTIRLLVP